MPLFEAPSFLRSDQIKTDADSLLQYGRDWTRVYPSRPVAILFPQTTEEVREIVIWARSSQTQLVPSGGRTGLSGGAVAAKGEVVVSFDRMNQILELNETDRILRCQSGVVTEKIQNLAAEKGFYFPIDFASKGSSQIGGNIATNAGGTKVIRYGLTREHISSLEVVTGRGEILHLNRDLTKNNAGYDLRQLFIGSEGSLGLITTVGLKLTNPPKNLSVLLLAISDLRHSTEILERFRKRLSITAFEFFTDVALRYVLRNSSELQAPFENPAPVYLLLEFEALSDQDIESALQIFEGSLSEKLVIDGVLSQNDQQAQNFWKYRENISECLAPFRPYKNDISTRISKIPAFVREVEEFFAAQMLGLEIVWFGHIGDGNLHINIIDTRGRSPSEFAALTADLSTQVFSLVQKFGGSISAEHGVGLVKKPYLAMSVSPEEIEMMKLVKKIFDPDGILNPGKIFDLDACSGGILS